MKAEELNKIRGHFKTKADTPMPASTGTERFSHDFSNSSTLRTKVGLLQTRLTTDKYASADGGAYGGCQWLRINREKNMYASVFTPHWHQETQGLVRVAPAAKHSVGRHCYSITLVAADNGKALITLAMYSFLLVEFKLVVGQVAYLWCNRPKSRFKSLQIHLDPDRYRERERERARERERKRQNI